MKSAHVSIGANSMLLPLYPSPILIGRSLRINDALLKTDFISSIAFGTSVKITLIMSRSFTYLIAVFLMSSLLAKDRDRNASTTPTLTEKAISAGFNHTLIIQQGEVFASGENIYGQLGNGVSGGSGFMVKVLGIENIIAVSAGRRHSMALRADGKVFVWGDNTFFQNGTLGGTSSIPVLVPGLSDIIDIQAGDYHCLALKSNGEVISWGSNFRGELGRGFTSTSASPGAVVDPSGSGNLGGVTVISSGSRHSLAIKDGNVLTWGENTNSQLGLTGVPESNIPVYVKRVYVSVVGNLSNIISLSAGETHSLAMDVEGKLWSWGEGKDGQLGIGAVNPSIPSTYTRHFAENVASRIRTMAAGRRHSMAVDGAGEVLTFGSNANGQLGISFGIPKNDVPTYSGFNRAVGLACGDDFTILIQSDGVIFGSGKNYDMQFGGTPFPTMDSFFAFFNRTGKMAQLATHKNSYLLMADGTVHSSGDDVAIGFPTSATTTSFTQIPSLHDIISIGSTGFTSYAVDVNGRVWAWGSNVTGAIGIGMTGGYFDVPIPIPNLADIVYIDGAQATAPSSPHINAISVSGDLYAWGFNLNYQLGDGTTTSKNAPILITSPGKIFSVAAGQNNTFALYANNDIQSWGVESTGGVLAGTGTSGKLKTPVLVASGTKFKSVSAKRRIRLALTTNGEIHAWGSSVNSPNFFDVCTSTFSNKVQVPTAIRNTRGGTVIEGVKHIETGDDCGFFIEGDGSVSSWGRNLSKELGIVGASSEEKNPGNVTYTKSGYSVPMFHSISAHHHFLGNQTTDVIITWGDNLDGQLGLGFTSSWELATPAARIAFDPVLALEDETLTQMKVYPNPAQEILNIDLEIGLKGSNVKLIDSSGKLIYDLLSQQQNMTLDLSSLESGVYIIRIGNTYAKQIIVSK